MLAKLKQAALFIKRRPKRAVVVLMLVGFVVLNLLAYIHAHAMTHFVEGGERTPAPESLSWTQKVAVLATGVRLARPANHSTPNDFELQFTQHSFETSDGTNLSGWHIAADDSRGVCLFFHGYGAAKSSLLPEAGQFQRWGYDAFLVDFRGSGDSAGDVTTIGYLEADDVASAVEYVRANFADKPLWLYGRSMGSAAILRAIAEYDLKPSGVILECPFDRLLSTAQNRFAAMGLPGFPAAQLLVFWGGAQHGYSGFEHNPVDYAANVRCPVLVLGGEADPRVTQPQLRAVFDKLAGPKQIHIFEEVGHAAYLPAAPHTWEATVRSFLEAPQ
ncbi:Alpha/beta hydrolase family protein [Symmachiella dynata]|uniref:Alpha/beta hydrolase family protein n=1 Tax=Symmachiella dynata TaxID=2527995 RepID=A0A517ZYI7_9PLAN|nr:alpha/beta fold hydrolase [Symmachiella dynata]QDU47555.1 Alpha/beta hydrolase family protein [Symmachiella dynata]